MNDDKLTFWNAIRTFFFISEEHLDDPLGCLYIPMWLFIWATIFYNLFLYLFE